MELPSDMTMAVGACGGGGGGDGGGGGGGGADSAEALRGLVVDDTRIWTTSPPPSTPLPDHVPYSC